MEDLSATTAGMTPPLAREASTPNIERILQELSLLNKEGKKEVFFGLQKLLADDGFYTFRVWG